MAGAKSTTRTGVDGFAARPDIAVNPKPWALAGSPVSGPTWALITIATSPPLVQAQGRSASGSCFSRNPATDSARTACVPADKRSHASAFALETRATAKARLDPAFTSVALIATCATPRAIDPADATAAGLKALLSLHHV